jgi:hypothetical protein
MFVFSIFAAAVVGAALVHQEQITPDILFRWGVENDSIEIRATFNATGWVREVARFES